MSHLVSAFNNHFTEFIEDVQTVFPDNADILTASNAIALARKGNPKLLPKLWTQFVVGPYSEQIAAGDIAFFVDKDYGNDVLAAANNKHAAKIMGAIDRLREPVRNMAPEDQAKAMKYIQNLTELAKMIG